MCLDNNKRVQEAGCSAFATLEEEAGAELEPFLGSILGNLVFAFNKYQQKNLLILYDAIGTLADAVGSALNNPAFIDVLMPPLIARWGTLQDGDGDLIPLLECLSSVVIAIGQGFGAYAQPVFERCVRIVHQSLLEFQAFRANPAQIDEPDKTFLIVSLDLLSGLTQGLNSSITQLYLASEPPVLNLLALCLQVCPFSRFFACGTDGALRSAPGSSCTTVIVRAIGRYRHLLFPHPQTRSRRFHARSHRSYRSRTSRRERQRLQQCRVGLRRDRATSGSGDGALGSTVDGEDRTGSTFE